MYQKKCRQSFYQGKDQNNLNFKKQKNKQKMEKMHKQRKIEPKKHIFVWPTNYWPPVF